MEEEPTLEEVEKTSSKDQLHLRQVTMQPAEVDAGGDVWRQMREMRTACEDEIQAQRGRVASAVNSLRQSLLSLRTSVPHALVSNADKLSRLKDGLKGLETALAESLAVKSRKDSNYAVIEEYLPATRDRINHLKKILDDQRTKKDKYTVLMSTQLAALDSLEAKSNQDMIEKASLEEAILWYHKFLGFRAECGEGVKFVFNKINLQNPDKEYSFTIRLDNDQYILLQCDPYVPEINGLIEDLNRSNDLFNIVRTIREVFRNTKFGGVPSATSLSVATTSSTVICSPPPVSVDSTSETRTVRTGSHSRAKNRMSKKNFPLPRASPMLSPNARRSPRLMERKTIDK